MASTRGSRWRREALAKPAALTACTRALVPPVRVGTGEGVTDSSVWLVKSHWPERKGCEPIAVHAAVLIVRSPFDVIDSYWNMVLTSSHNHSVQEGEYARLSSAWRDVVRWAPSRLPHAQAPDCHTPPYTPHPRLAQSARPRPPRSCPSRREIAIWAEFHRYWMRAATSLPLLAIRYEDLLDGERRQQTLQLVAAFLCTRAQAADGASPAAAQAALAGMLGRVRQAAEEHARKGGIHRAGVYAPRRGVAGASLAHYPPELRREVTRVAGAEMCLFKYDADPDSPRLGCPLDGPPHTVYIDPDDQAGDGGDGGGDGDDGGDGGDRDWSAQARVAGALVLNRGSGLRPADDARGWKWKEKLASQRDGSLLYEPSAVARIEENADGWSARPL